MWKYPYKTTPYEHQRNALNESAEKVQWAYFMEMGTGKTKVTIDNIAYLFFQRKINSVLIIAPKSVYLNWETEIETHMPDVLKYKIYKWNIDKPKDYHDLQNFKDLRIFLINVEALSTKRGFEACKEYLLKNKLNFVTLDESTTIKNRSAKRTKNILALQKLSMVRRILTGSPVTKSPLDLYTQCAFLDPALLGFKSFYAFRNRYCTFDEVYIARGEAIMVPDGFTNLDELEQKLKAFSLRLTKDECLDIPEKVYQKREIELSGEQKRVYQRLKIEALAKFENETISVHNQLTEILRLHQVANGYCKSDDGEILQFNNEKLKAMMEILEETDQKVIIWANYVHNIHEIIGALNDKYGSKSVVSIYGEVSQQQRMIAVERFQNDPECRFFVGNPTTGGYGLTLTAAKYVIYYSNNYNLEVRLQSEDRAHRIGQTKNVVYIDIIAKDTIDERIVQALKRKIQLSAKTLGDKAKDWLL